MTESNGINTRQMQEANLDRLAAQRQLYSKAKRVVWLQFFLSVFVVVLISMLSLLLKSQRVMGCLGYPPIDIAWMVTISGVLIAIVDLLVLSPLADRLREQAAKIQELFDGEVLQLPWNAITVGVKPSVEQVHQNAEAYRAKHQGFTDLEHWYCPEADTVPLAVGRIICQRSNVWWDAELRGKFNAGIFTVAAVLFLVLFVLGLVGDLHLKTFLTKVVAPFLPMLLFSARQVMQNRETIERLSSLRASADAAFQQAQDRSLSPAVLDDTARRLQDNIFEHRKSSPLIFDWFYRCFRTPDEALMNVSCKELVQQYER